jgi:hypothetical protein
MAEEAEAARRQAQEEAARLAAPGAMTEERAQVTGGAAGNTLGCEPRSYGNRGQPSRGGSETSGP